MRKKIPTVIRHAKEFFLSEGKFFTDQTQNLLKDLNTTNAISKCKELQSCIFFTADAFLRMFCYNKYYL